jgi:hypothetical protein
VDTLVKGGLATAGIVLAAGLFIAGVAGRSATWRQPADTDYVGSGRDWREEVCARKPFSVAPASRSASTAGNQDFIAFQLGRAIAQRSRRPTSVRKATAARQSCASAMSLAQLSSRRSGAPLALRQKGGRRRAGKSAIGA